MQVQACVFHGAYVEVRGQILDVDFFSFPLWDSDLSYYPLSHLTGPY